MALEPPCYSIAGIWLSLYVKVVTVTEFLVGHCSKCFICIISLNSSEIPMVKLVLLPPLYNEEIETSRD